MLACFACIALFCANADAQRARFPDFFSSQGGTSIPAPSSNLPALPGSFQSQSIITTPPIQLTPPPATLQQPNFAPQGVIQNPVVTPTFDPYQTQNQPFPVFPRVTQPPPVQVFPQSQPQYTQPQFTQPQYTQPQYNPQQYNPQIGVPQFGGPSTNSWPKQAWESFQTDFLPRVLERPRFRQTYMPGSGGNDLGINEIELGTTLTIPNFLQGPTPLRISPGFIFNYWAGPDSVVNPGFDLPPRAYSSYLAFDHITDTAKVSGIESNLTVGYYSDFNNTSSDAIRVTGKALGWYRINSYMVGKFGVEYFDRVSTKLLPGVGVYMTPIPDLKLDLYFPKAKVSHRVPNINNLEVWAYAGGEYGGGSWAIERADSSNDQADINDVRAYLGLEWMGTRRVTGFVEFGYVFERKLLYRSDPSNVLDLKDTLMLRSGLAF